LSNAGLDLQASIARRSAVLEQTLTRLALPATTIASGLALADLGEPGSEPGSVRRAFGDAAASITRDSDIDNQRARAATLQELKQGGGNLNLPATRETLAALDDSTRKTRATSLRALALTEAQTGLNETNTLMSLLSGAGGNALSGALKFGASGVNAGGLLASISQQGQQQGQAIGSIAGTILGGILGTLAYGQTALGAGLGGAAGGAVGGWIGG
jgi:hypothetical protein